MEKGEGTMRAIKKDDRKLHPWKSLENVLRMRRS